MQCPSCGHTNDVGNRFCEYCGVRLDPSIAQETTIPGPPPSFGADPSYDAPTMFVPSEQAPPAPAMPDAPATPSEPDAPEASLGTPSALTATCPSCGYANIPGDMFCDQCGASLPQSSTQSSETSAPAEPAADPLLDQMLQQSTPAPSQAAPAADKPVAAVAPPSDDKPVEAPAEAAPAADEPVAAVAPPSDDKPAEAPAEAAPAGRSRDAVSAAIDEHRENLTMFEQMAQRYQGRDLPAHIATGIDESRRALADAEAELAALDAAAAQTKLPDPAELERLQNAIDEHRENLTMFEQMAQRYQGRDLPAHIATGIDESRRALADAEAELATLQGAAPTASQAQPVTPVAASEPMPEAPAPPAPSEPEAAPAVPAMPKTEPAWAMPSAMPQATPAPEAPAPAPMPVLQPRLVVESSGTVLALAADKQEFVIGREDPISGIYPDVDLTPHGGDGGGVSRQHAKLYRNGDAWQIEDLNSTNSTRVNGTKIMPHAPADLKPGDKVMIGRIALLFQTS